MAKKGSLKKPAKKAAKTKTKKTPSTAGELVDYMEANRNLKHEDFPLHLKKNYEAAGLEINS